MERTSYWLEPRQLTLLRGWSRENVPEREIASRMGRSLLGLRSMKRRYPQIREALAQTGELTDYLVEESLLKAAMGYRYTEEKTEQTEKGDKLVTTEKEATPNVSAISLWLKRHKPQMWDEEQKGTEDRAENNLLEALGHWEEEVFTEDELQELQQTAEAGSDLVEAEPVPTEGRTDL